MIQIGIAYASLASNFQSNLFLLPVSMQKCLLSKASIASNLTMRCTRRHLPPCRVHSRQACLAGIAGELGR